ncbi:hypothetical protein OJAV_G00052040 [Oryzias javanicus]|uniref:Uncharacterized protein n=1 Tax=Oryzias javanicus TaxID=123683 RepID=A0A437D9Z1_ORYJA|nr:hypothetical protein OJAV_G00052040 [Oryzias javanicus]
MGKSCSSCVDPHQRNISAGRLPLPPGSVGYGDTGVTGTVSGTGRDRCGSVELQRLVDLKLPDVPLPAVFDQALIVDLNSASKRVMGERKYPALHLSGADSGEMFGLEYAEPETRPVPLNWNKHKSRSAPAPTETPHPPSSPLTPSSELPPPTPETPARIFQSSSQLTDSPVEDQTVQPQTKIEDAAPSPLPLLPTPGVGNLGHACQSWNAEGKTVARMSGQSNLSW